MIGGTASVRGEESVYTGNLTRQLEETFQNLLALLTAAFPEPSDNPLRHLHNLRVYYPRPDDLSEIRHACTVELGGNLREEFIQAELCRSDLLVEVEGLAITTNR